MRLCVRAGEMESEEFLITLITQQGQFRWGTADDLGSTYMPQVRTCVRVCVCAISMTLSSNVRRTNSPSRED